MPSIICIKKDGTIKTRDLTSIEKMPINLKNISDLDKKKIKYFKNYSSECDFTMDNETITILGKIKGKSGYENKKELPPPIDKEIYFDNVYAIAHNDGMILDLSIEKFEEFYENAFGGFEELGEDDTWSEEDEENTEDRDFIDDGEIESASKSDDDEEEEYEFSDNETSEDEYEDEDSANEIDNEKSNKSQKDSLCYNTVFDKGFEEGKKYYYNIQVFLRELDNSLVKRRKLFYSLSPLLLSEIIYNNHKNNRKNIVIWLENQIKDSKCKDHKNMYKKYLKRYNEDFINNS